MMDKLRKTFDYHRFSPNRRLSAMIDEVERRYNELSDEKLSFVAAAGEPYRMEDNDDKDNRKY